MTTELHHIPLDHIDPGFERARTFDPAWAEALAAIIRTQGLTHPISVRRVGEGYRLVAGMHRLEAFRLMGADEIPCTISAAETDDEARLEEVMENLGRNELIALDRCRHLCELKQVWERMYPEAAHGKASPKTQKMRLSSDAPQIFGFAKATAEKIGLSKRAIEQDVAIWKGLSQNSRLRLAGMPMAGKMTELKALSEQKHPRQQQILDLILDPEHRDIQNVAEAIFRLEHGITPNVFHRRFLTASRTLAKLDDRVFDDVIMAHEARVIASLQRRGRI